MISRLRIERGGTEEPSPWWQPEPHRIFFEGAYWTTDRGNICVVAVLNPDVGDWAAYIGGVRGMLPRDTVLDVADHGGKLTEAEALHWFGDVEELVSAPRGYRR